MLNATGIPPVVQASTTDLMRSGTARATPSATQPPMDWPTTSARSTFR